MLPQNETAYSLAVIIYTVSLNYNHCSLRPISEVTKWNVTCLVIILLLSLLNHIIFTSLLWNKMSLKWLEIVAWTIKQIHFWLFLLQSWWINKMSRQVDHPPSSWISRFQTGKSLESITGAKYMSGTAKWSTEMKCLRKIEQNWSLNCKNRSIIGDLTSDPVASSGFFSFCCLKKIWWWCEY